MKLNQAARILNLKTFKRVVLALMLFLSPFVLISLVGYGLHKLILFIMLKLGLPFHILFYFVLLLYASLGLYFMIDCFRFIIPFAFDCWKATAPDSASS